MSGILAGETQGVPVRLFQSVSQLRHPETVTLTPAQYRAALMQSRQYLRRLLNQTAGVRLIELRESSPLPEPLASYWRDFVRLDQPLGDRLPPIVGSEDREEWILAALTGRAFPTRFLFELPPVTALIEVLTPAWLVYLSQVLIPFDLLLLDEERTSMVAFGDDEDGLWRLVVQDGRLVRPLGNP